MSRTQLANNNADLLDVRGECRVVSKGNDDVCGRCCMTEFSETSMQFEG
jgi:hypothetical protein